MINIIDWLVEHKQAYKDCLNHFEVINLESVSDADLVGWISEHKQLNEDFKNHRKEKQK